jgi:hypothetical protein
MCILNGIQIWAKDVILHIFLKKSKSAPLYVCIRGVQQKCGEQIIRDAHDRWFTKIKLREAYVLSAKIGRSGLANRNIRFSQHNQKNRNIWFGKLDYLIFPDGSY